MTSAAAHVVNEEPYLMAFSWNLYEAVKRTKQHTFGDKKSNFQQLES